MSTRISAKVRGLGHRYADGLEHLSVDVKKTEAMGLPFQDGVRVPIDLQIGNESYRAGLRTTRRMPTVWVSPNLIDSRGEKTTLARVLNAHRLQKNQAVMLDVEDSTVRLTPADALS